MREASVRILPGIAELSTAEVRGGVLVRTFFRFLGDPSDFVVNTAQMQLGRFICSLKPKEITEKLLKAYASLADPKANSESEVLYSCAYNFPGVLFTAGAKEWTLLKTVYNNLMKSKDASVRVTMLLSIHEVAKILGPKLTAERLDSIVKDALVNKTTMKFCLTHLHEFLAVLNEPQRMSYLELINFVIANSRYEWRIREVFALHAEEYAKLFEPRAVHKHIFHTMCALARDTVGEVRTPACRQLPKIILRFQSEAECFDEAMRFLHKLATAATFRDRQVFLMVCEGFMESKEVFEKYLLTDFLALQKDEVVNVRITLAKVLRAHLNSTAILTSNMYMMRTIMLLKEDKSREVRESASEVVNEKKARTVNLELLEKAQEMAAEELSSATDKDEEVIEEMKRQENEKMLKNTIKIDEVEYEAAK